MSSTNCRLFQKVPPSNYHQNDVHQLQQHTLPHQQHHSSTSSSYSSSSSSPCSSSFSSSSFSFSSASFSSSSAAVPSKLCKDNKTKETKQKATKNAKKSKIESKMLKSPLKIKQRSRGTGLKFGGKKPHQVAKRNERERKRVRQMNMEYETLANKLSMCRNVINIKLTKATTLKAAIAYIRYLELLLSSERGDMDGTAEKEFRRQCLAIAAMKDEETADDGEDDKDEDLMEDKVGQQHEQKGPADEDGTDHFSPPSSDHFSPIPFPPLSSSDHSSSFTFSAADQLTSFSCAPTPSFSPSFCCPHATFNHLPPAPLPTPLPASLPTSLPTPLPTSLPAPPPSHSLLPSPPLFSYSSSVPFHLQF